MKNPAVPLDKYRKTAQYRKRLKAAFGYDGFDAVVEKDFVTIFRKDEGLIDGKKSKSFDSPYDAEVWLASHMRKENSGQVPPSSRVRNREKFGSEFEKAAKLYEDFTGHKAEPLAQVRVPDHPPVAFVVGRCDGVLYTTVRDGKREKYIHRFKASDAPILCVSPDGFQLLLFGGNFRFTERGIVDLSSREA